jgi:hypothetical protein
MHWRLVQAYVGAIPALLGKSRGCRPRYMGAAHLSGLIGLISIIGGKTLAWLISIYTRMFPHRRRLVVQQWAGIAPTRYKSPFQPRSQGPEAQAVHPA